MRVVKFILGIIAALLAWLVLDLAMAASSTSQCHVLVLKGQGWSSVLHELDHCGYRTGISLKAAAKTGTLQRVIGTPKPGMLDCNRDLAHCLKGITHIRILAVDVEPGMTAWDAANRIALAYEIPEYTMWDLLTDPMLAARAHIPPHKGVISPFEGFLGTGLYRFDSGLDPMEVLLNAARKGLSNIDHLKPPAMDTYNFVTLASIVQKEGSKPSDMARIARVFLNRLHKGMPLQSDPTMVYMPYGLHLRACPALRRDRMNPYNTYTHSGLPTGPICNPGRKAMYATSHPYNGPDAHDLLFFVAKGDGTHVFTKTFQAHKRAINQYLHKHGRTETQ